MFRKLIFITSIVFICALALVACGTGSSQPPSQTSQPTASQTSAPSAQATAAPKPTITSAPGPQTIEVKYTYDGAGRLTQAEFSTGEKIIYTYDKAGSLLAQEIKK
jgi:YD repeat-containing protein